MSGWSSHQILVRMAIPIYRISEDLIGIGYCDPGRKPLGILPFNIQVESAEER